MPKYRTRSLTVDAALSPTGLWIVTNPDGWAFTVHPEVFKATYEPVPEPKPMSLRFGPKLTQSVGDFAPPTDPTPPDVPPARLLVEVEPFIDGVVPSINGLFTLNVGVKIGESSPETHRTLERVFAVAFPAGSVVPDDPQACIDSDVPKGELDASQQPGMSTQVFPIHGVAAGMFDVQFVYQDAD